MKILCLQPFGRTFLILWGAILLFTGGLKAAQDPVPPRSQGDADRYIVIFERPSVAQMLIESNAEGNPGTLRRAFSSKDAAAYAKELETSQKLVMERYRPSGMDGASRSDRNSTIEVLVRRTGLLNMMGIRADAETATRLRQDKDVKNVYPDPLRYPLLDAATSLVNAPVAWALAGGADSAGRGVKIGIIDTGINHNHPMFNDAGFEFPPLFPKGQLAATNKKVIVARSYYEANDPNALAIDQTGHGTSVAGIAAGNETAAPLASIRGVAPGAWLGNYNVFGTKGNATSSSVIAAINDAVEDGMDIINLSLGGTAQDPATDPEQLAVAIATQLGVVVVISAGNDGPEPGTITSPGTAPAAITVGAVTNAGTFSPLLSVTSNPPPPEALQKIGYTAGDGVNISSDIGPFPLQSVIHWDSSEEACTPLPDNVLAGVVALVKRGSCLFQTKSDNVFAAGAEALIVYNNISGGTVRMLFGEVGPAGPAVMISLEKGEPLSELAQSREVSVVLEDQSQLGRVPAAGDFLAGFSSRGPNIDFSLKPDLVAVGQGIYAPTLASKYNLSANGTSFSSPMVAGGAAIIRQLHPEWSVRTIKSVLANTAVQTVLWNNESAHITQIGNGRLDLGQAAQATTAVEPVSYSFGLIDDDSVATGHSTEFTVSNLETTSQTYSFSYHSLSNESSVSLSITPDQMTLQPNESVQVELQLEINLPVSGGSFSGELRISPQGNGIPLKAVIWGGIVFEDRSVTLKVAQDGSADFTDLPSALAQANAGNLIEIQDSAVYPGGLKLGFNEEGLPHKGLTLRAAQGASPVLDGGAGAEPVLAIEGVEGITIQGLRFRRGRSSIEVRNSSAIIKDNFIENTMGEDAGLGINLIDSRAHILGNVIQNVPATALTLFSSDALIQENQIGSLSPGGGESSGNLDHGAFVSPNSSASFFNNVVAGSGFAENSSGSQGIRISSAQVLLKGNQIVGTRGDLGDGVLALGNAEVTLVDNLIEENSRHGVSAFSGANLIIQRNELQNNSASGAALTDSFGNLLGTSRLVGNQIGLSLTHSGLIVHDSLLANSSGDGILGQNSDLTVANATFFGNEGRGLAGVNNTSTLVTNSIFWGQGGEDITGLTVTSVLNNLLEKGQFNGQNQNFSADPLFEDEAGGLFSLKKGSPAVDRSTVSLVVSNADLASHQRSVDGDGDGVAVPDLGALEQNASHAPSLILPRLSSRQGEFVGFALTNSFQPASQSGMQGEGKPVLLHAYAEDGNLLKSVAVPIDGLTQFAELVDNLFPQATAWIEILSPQPDLKGFTLVGKFNLAFMDGAQFSTPASARLVFPEIRNSGKDETTIFFVNPHLQPQTIELTWQGNGSAQVSSIELAAKSSVIATFQELFPGKSGGYLVAEAAEGLPLFGMEIFGSENTRAGLLALSGDDTHSSLAGAQLVILPEFETLIQLINLGETSTATLTAYSEAGIPTRIANITIGAGRSMQLIASDVFNLAGQEFVGWVSVEGTAASNLLGSLTFEDKSGGTMASLPLQSLGAREFVLGHVAHNELSFTGITLLNDSLRTALVSIEVFDQAGTLTGLRLTELPPRNKRALLLNEWLPEIEAQDGGFIRIRSNVPLFGFELFGAWTSSFLASVPQQVVVH